MVKKRSKPLTTGEFCDSLLAQLDTLEASQEQLNQVRESMAELAAKLKNSELLTRLDALAEKTPTPPAFDKKDFDGFEDMYS